MKKIILFILVTTFSLFAIAQNVEKFEVSHPADWAFTNMEVKNTDVICGNSSLHSVGAFKIGKECSMYSCTTKMAGSYGIQFAYRIQLNKNTSSWTMKVQVLDSAFDAVYTITKTGTGNVTNSSCGSNNFVTTTPYLKQGNYRIYVLFTTNSNDYDQNNRVVVDNFDSEPFKASMPVRFASSPKVTHMYENYFTVEFDVADESQIKQYNIQLSKDAGKTWYDAAFTIPPTTQLNTHYSVNIKIVK